MRKYFPIYEEAVSHVYDFATAPFRISLNLRKIRFSFFSVYLKIFYLRNTWWVLYLLLQMAKCTLTCCPPLTGQPGGWKLCLCATWKPAGARMHSCQLGCTFWHACVRRASRGRPHKKPASPTIQPATSWNPHNKKKMFCRARICKRFWSPEIDSEESMPLAYVA
jgi:hypothetical protein